MTDMRDELLDSVVDELQTLPPIDEAAVGRIVRAAATHPGSERSARSMMRGRSWWQSKIPLAAAAGLALAAGLAGYAVRGDGPAARIVEARATPAESLTLVAAADRGRHTPDRAVPTQFVLDAPRASRVSLVGDFNAWDDAATPLARVSSGGIWTVTVPLAPGRHTYAFMIDGVVTLDPRAPAARDLDFGTPSSVVLVGAP